MIEHYLAVAKPWLEQYGYLALFGGVFVEGFGMPAPGETLIIGASLLAGQGDMQLAAVMLTAWFAAVLGDNLGYLMGRWGGRRLFLKIGVKADHLAHVERFFTRFGGGVVVAARFFEVLRQLNGVVAGSMRMPWWRFVAFNALGAGRSSSQTARGAPALADAQIEDMTDDNYRSTSADASACSPSA